MLAILVRCVCRAMRTGVRLKVTRTRGFEYDIDEEYRGAGLGRFLWKSGEGDLFLIFSTINHLLQ